MQRLFDLARPYSPLAPIRMRRARTAALESTRRPAEVQRIARQLARVAETVAWGPGAASAAEVAASRARQGPAAWGPGAASAAETAASRAWKGPAAWGRVQDDRWDRLSRFIYRTRSADAVRQRAEATAATEGLGADATAFVQYALRRWYCFWGARLAELLFLGHAGVRPGPPTHHEIDFTIDGVPFDLKTTEVPRVFAGPVEAWAGDPGKLAAWLYRHQSREGRFHTANRLFLVLCDPARPEEAWRLRGDERALSHAIDAFMRHRRYVELEVDDHVVLTAVVPVLPIAEGSGLQLGLPLPPAATVSPAPTAQPAQLPLFS